MPRLMILGGLVLVMALLTGCRDEAPVPAAVTPSLIEVTAQRTDLLYRYRDAEGAWQQAIALDEIPAEARAKVVVVDLAQSPEQRAAGQVVQLFDLRQPGADGRFPGRLVPRGELEQALAAELAEKLEARKQAPVTMYSASWCGVCKKARAFLDDAGIAYVEKDIEKDQAAARELRAKAQAQGVDASGVPVFDIGGKLVAGFDPNTLRRLARGG
ncbi:MAG: hypothetical protein KC613_08475 [Myxococcales bacterium]|nr:hypothetical protein [Myxococcales bacterium]